MFLSQLRSIVLPSSSGCPSTKTAPDSDRGNKTAEALRIRGSQIARDVADGLFSHGLDPAQIQDIVKAANLLKTYGSERLGREGEQETRIRIFKKAMEVNQNLANPFFSEEEGKAMLEIMESTKEEDVADLSGMAVEWVESVIDVLDPTDYFS
ncbi:hypothetical protein K432DRAFT_442801 [Lepidopterella palustris CBS 459.81]|uniref:Uncharacterized protein n=1 Tax=Lepidopterella palustris CBS 459.81 TaxID=1314670 RepID=A0A8E2EBQ8_9PEZI|nr:hypothetical protein K432DRAFT_442801 [Lepidopterella palustris CBS 459.81]